MKMTVSDRWQLKHCENCRYKDLDVDECEVCKVCTNYSDWTHPDTLSPEEFKQRMLDIRKGYSKELGHVVMDELMIQILRSFGYGEGCDIFDNAPKWYA